MSWWQQENVWQLILIGAILLLLLVFAFLRIRYPFWSFQPVFHPYDAWRYLSWCPHVIQNGPAANATKYIATYPDQRLSFQRTLPRNSFRVTTTPYLDVTPAEQEQIVDFLQTQYVTSEQIVFPFLLSDLQTLCTGYGAAPSLVSCLSRQKLPQLQDDLAQSMDACLVAYPVRLCARERWNDDVVHVFTLYFWDIIAAHKYAANETILRTLLQTHEANQRKLAPDVGASIFRKEKHLSDGIVPLTVYQISLFSLQNSVKQPPLPPTFTVVRALSKEKIDAVSDFLYTVSHTFANIRVACFPEITAISQKIHAGSWFVYLLQSKGVVFAMYVFQDSKMIYDDQHLLQLCCAMRQNLLSDNIFFAGFLHALYDTLSFSPQFGVLAMHTLGNTGTLVEKWKWKYSPFLEYPAAFYLYNFVVPGMPLAPEACMCML